jgi:tRNA threonylcarbamoyl adenosine modification protein (Sua5/YciO/YrdC/YwlC family)
MLSWVFCFITTWIGISGFSFAGGKTKAPGCQIIAVEDFYSDLWKIDPIIGILNSGGVGIIPTDTCYSFVTSIHSKEGIQRILKLKNEGIKKPLSVICKDISTIAKYSSNMADQKWVYKILKGTLPGPYTYILPSSKEVPSILVDHKKHMRRWKRREIGVRIPNDELCIHVSGLLDFPLISGSVPDYGEDLDISTYAGLDAKNDDEDDFLNDEIILTDEEENFLIRGAVDGNNNWISKWTRDVDFIIDSGDRGGQGRSTVVDLTTGAPFVLRQGTGVFDEKLY